VTFNNRFTLQFERILSGDSGNIEDTLRIFPNPTTGTLNIQPPDGSIQKAMLFDLQGRMLLKKVFLQKLKEEKEVIFTA